MFLIIFDFVGTKTISLVKKGQGGKKMCHFHNNSNECYCISCEKKFS
jgi:hypothetical protein